ncbi:MAG: UDP-N-acetylmuramoyl-L-alanine--D-glutamate ligase [Bacilli bacterium]|nr:UDP-N-acetylmuramoyl-L-alanine--D-glutamate ligase [Bacilli bacterium]
MKNYEQFKNYKFLLYGLGLSNQAVQSFFDEHNFSYEVFVDDSNSSYDLTNIDIIIKSPGIFPDTKLLIDAAKLNKLVINDLELFSWFYPLAKFILVTGTNGKTSTSKMISTIVTKKQKCYLGGNIGVPLFSLKSNKNFKDEIIVVETSSFMLQHCYSVKPIIYVLLNIGEHHLDYHKSFKEYFYQKTKLVFNLPKESLLICPDEEIFINEFCSIDCNKVFFSNEIDGLNFKLIDDKLYYKEEVLYKINSYPIIPKHQLKNIMVATIVGLHLNISISKIRKALEDLTYEDFRLQKVLKTDDVLIINDSKSTNWNASLAALESVNVNQEEFHWIVGGFGPSNISMCHDMLSKVDCIHLIGQNKNDIRKELSNYDCEVSLYNDLEDIIKNLHSNKNKQIILFSPASQSFDMYKNYIERGETFNKLINKYWHN